MGDVPPTGRPVNIGYTQVLRFEHGKHASFNLMFDRLQLLEQLGLIPDKGNAPVDLGQRPDQLKEGVVASLKDVNDGIDDTRSRDAIP